MNISTAELFVGLAGLLLGAFVTFVWAVSESRTRGEHVPTGAAGGLSAGAEEILAVLPSSAMIIDENGLVLQSSAPAVALGLVRNRALSVPELERLVNEVRRDGLVRDADFTIQVRRRPPLHVHARIAPVGQRAILVLVDDRTREHQVEAVRRDFVANVSHELKTPIGALNLLAEAVGEAKDDPEAVERFSSRMTVETERLTRLVQQIIDLSRLQNDARSHDPVEISVAGLVAEAAEHSATDAEDRKITIGIQAAEDLHLRGDRGQLRAAVSNLVENAVTYSPDGSAIQVAATRDGDVVRIGVTDNGIGIPDSEVERIFERFYRVDPARARATGGTGLGLSIVKHVAASHGGTVEVWSEPGLGSTFTLVLPLFEPDEESA